MNKFTFLLTIISCNILLAQPPTGYYNNATGTGYTLKTQLYQIISNYQPQIYNLVDNFMIENDKDIYYENDNTILDIYSEKPTTSDPYNFTSSQACGNYNSEGDCWNKEHVIPQSVFSQNEPMRGDAHHLLPTDGRVNGFRSNYPFGWVGSNLVSQSGISNPTLNGSKLGNAINTGIAAGYSNIVFEPINEFKGDIARIYFYFVTRYQNEIPNWSFPMFNGTTNVSISNPFLNILYQWHIQDPVSQKEINRNNAIYTYQGNRNPFIDNPQWVATVWGANLGINDLNLKLVTIFPNPSSQNFITIQSENNPEMIQLFSINGQLIQEFYQPKFYDHTFMINNLEQGFYFVKLSFQDQIITQKIIIN
ncbi:MAG: endonuclease [Flavobacterium sp.]